MLSGLHRLFRDSSGTRNSPGTRTLLKARPDMSLIGPNTIKEQVVNSQNVSTKMKPRIDYCTNSIMDMGAFVRNEGNL